MLPPVEPGMFSGSMTLRAVNWIFYLRPRAVINFPHNERYDASIVRVDAITIFSSSFMSCMDIHQGVRLKGRVTGVPMELTTAEALTEMDLVLENIWTFSTCFENDGCR